jgi:cytochrome c556
MTLKKITAFALAGLMSVGIVATVLADDAASLAPDKAVAARRAAMKEDGKTLRGSDAFTGDKAIKALQTVYNNYTRLASLFPKGSVTADSHALPLIWSDWDNFTGIFKKGADAATQGIAAAKAGDTAGYQAAVKTIADTCGTCHMTYRASLS